MDNLIKICCDNFFICQRLKDIDKSYEVYFNILDKSFEVHSLEQMKSSYCFKVPYDALDSRTLDYALKTRRENRDKLIEEIEKSNALLYEKQIKEQANLIKEIICT